MSSVLIARIIRFIGVALVFLSLAACGPGAPAPGELQSFANACDKPNEGRLIAVEGYLRLPDSFTGTDGVELLLYPDMSFGGSSIGVMVQFGDGPNRAEPISGSFHDNDLNIRLADGRLAPFGTRLRVSGRMYYPLASQEFPCALKNLYLEAAK